MGAAGTSHPNGAMGGSLDDARPISEERQPAAMPAAKPAARSAYLEQDFGEAPEPQPVAPAPKPAAPQPETPAPIDWTAESARIRADIESRVTNFQMAAAAPLAQSLQSLPFGGQKTADELAQMSPEEMARYHQGIARREAIENIGGAVMPLIGGLQHQLANTMAANISNLRRNYAEKYPQHAQEVLKLADGLTPQQQSMPETYDHLVRMVAGKKVLEQEEDQRIRQATSRVATSGRGGFSAPQAGRVGAKDMKNLSVLLGGNKAAIERTVSELEAEGYISD